MQINENDKVKLKDGRKGLVVMVFEGSTTCEVDFGEYEEMVELEDIQKVVWF